MAVTSGTVNTNTYSKSHFYVNWQQASQSTGDNSTTINWQAGLYTGTSSSHDSYGSNAVKIYSVYINGSLVSSGGTWSNIKTAGNNELLSGSFTIGHNSDGTKSFEISISAWLYSNHNLSGSGTFELNTIPRYADITQFDVSAVDETTIKFTWGASASCDAIQYSIDGSGWIDGIFPTTNIGGLSANAQHSVRIRVKRADSQLWTESTTKYATTYDYPKPTSINNFTIGDGATVNLYNPLGRNVTLQIISNNDGSVIGTYSGTYQGLVNGEFKTTDAITRQYNSIPNDTSGTYYAKVTYGSSVKTLGTGTYSIDNSQGQHNPTFEATDWSYISDLTSLTNNNQTVINNQSTLTFNIDTPAVAKDGASIKKYVFKWGNKTNEENSNDVVKGSGSTLTVTAVDTRNYNTTTTLDLGENFVDYTSPTFNYQNTNTHRENGIEADTILNLSGQFFNNTFGKDGVQNELLNAKYYVSTDNQTFSEGYNIDINDFILNNDYYNLSDYQIHENGESGGFTVGTRYYLKVELTDKVSTLTITNIAVTDGKLAFDTFQDNNGDYHIGINGLADPDYNLYVHGNIGGNINIYSSDEIKTNDIWIDGKPIYRKVVSGTYTTPSTASSRVNIELLSGVSALVKKSGLYDVQNSTNPRVYIGDPVISTGGGIDAYSGITFNSSTNIVRMEVSVPQSAYHSKTGCFELTLEYTKITDTTSTTTRSVSLSSSDETSDLEDTNEESGKFIIYEEFGETTEDEMR